MPIDDKKTTSLEEQENYDVPVYVSPFFDVVNKRSSYDAELMIKGGTDVNKKDARGGTAGHIAVYMTDCDMLRMLLSHGLDLTIKDDWGDGETVPQIIKRRSAIPKLEGKMMKMQQILDEHMERLKLQEKSESEVIDASSSIGSAAQSRASSGSVKTLQTPLRDITSKHVEKPVKEDHLASADELDSNKSGVTGRWSGSHTSDLS